MLTKIGFDRKLVHRLVAKSFVANPNPEQFDMVNHLDGDKANNHFSNLEWTDNSGNQRHAFDTGLKNGLKGDKNGAATISNEKAMAIIRIMATSSFSNAEAAEYFEMPLSTMRKIKEGDGWHNLNNYRNHFVNE